MSLMSVNLFQTTMNNVEIKIFYEHDTTHAMSNKLDSSFPAQRRPKWSLMYVNLF